MQLPLCADLSGFGQSMLFEQPGLATFFHFSMCSFNYFCLTIIACQEKKKDSSDLFFFYPWRQRRWDSLPVLVSVKITKVCSQITLFLNNSTPFLNNLMSSVYPWQRDLSDGVPERKLDWLLASAEINWNSGLGDGLWFGHFSLFLIERLTENLTFKTKAK